MLVSQPGCAGEVQPPRNRLSAPLSWSRIQRHTALETISGISQGSSSSDRSTPLSGNRRWKNTASASPMTNCPAIDPTVNSTVLTSALLNRPT